MFEGFQFPDKGPVAEGDVNPDIKAARFGS
jgi:hypothetical protein